jgi:hypothetical protein
MSVGLEHPQVERFLARLDAAAVGLPPGRREELSAEIREHLAEALAVTAGDELAVRTVLDRLGSPDDIVAAERGDTPDGSAPSGGVPPGSVPPGYAPAGYAPLGYGVAAKPSPWGGLEIAAVLLLTVGLFLLPVVGPIAGLAFAWASTRWTRREKVVATVLTVLPIVILTLGVATVMVSRVSTSDGGVVGPVPVVESDSVAPPTSSAP